MREQLQTFIQASVISETKCGCGLTFNAKFAAQAQSYLTASITYARALGRAHQVYLRPFLNSWFDGPRTPTQLDGKLIDSVSLRFTPIN